MAEATREMIESLRKGDLVRVKHNQWGEPIEGRVHDFGGGQALWVGGHRLESLATFGVHYDLEVLERVPRPLYVNFPDRMKPVYGDVVKYKGQTGTLRWVYTTRGWTSTRHATTFGPTEEFWPDPGARPVLVLDGLTGEPVAS